MRHLSFNQDTLSKYPAMLTLCILLLSLCGLCVGYSETPDTQSCGDNRGPLMDDNTRSKILYYHEGTRFTLALGESPGQTDFLPPAKNLFKIRWNCDLEAKARALSNNCAPSAEQLTENLGKNVYNGTVPEVTDPRPIKKRQRKYEFISDSVDQWLLPSDKYPMNDNVTYNESLYSNSNLYTFANMAYDKIYQVGCNYEECPSGGTIRASLVCIYNTKVPDHAKLYQVGNKNPDLAGCNWKNETCKHLGEPNVYCDDLLCKVRTGISDWL